MSTNKEGFYVAWKGDENGVTIEDIQKAIKNMRKKLNKLPVQEKPMTFAEASRQLAKYK